MKNEWTYLLDFLKKDYTEEEKRFIVNYLLGECSLICGSYHSEVVLVSEHCIARFVKKIRLVDLGF